MVMISIGESERESGPEKDTLANVRATGEFVVNVVSEGLLAAMVASSEPVAQGTDEFTLAGIKAADCVSVQAPRVAAAPLSLECVVEDLRAYGTDHVVVGRVLHIHAAAGMVSDSFHVETTRMKPVGRMAGPLYCTGLVPRSADSAVAGSALDPAVSR
jgi:flavin reductase (DIM6/NTAB) family NADH-FMN oxidoreductase RutF